MNETKDRTYNGWTNYETWCVNLWMDNSEGDQTYYQTMADEAYEAADEQMTSDGSRVLFTKAERATLDLSNTLGREFEDGSQDLLENAKAQASVWADLLGAALSKVNWHEIAGHYIEEAVKSAEAVEVG